MSTPTNSSLHELRNQVIAKGNVSGTDRYIAHARGAVLTDVEGNDYLDFGGGIAVMNVGHSHPKVVAAIKEQAEKFTHTCFMVTPYEGPVRLAEKLIAAVPGDSPKSVMLVNCGAEAVENAIKIARYYTKKPAIIAFEGAFHGRTLMGMTLTSKVNPYKLGLGPFAPEVYRMPFAYCYRCPYGREYPSCDVECADKLNDFFVNHVAAEQTAAIIFEPVLGEGGFVAPPKEYFQRLQAICRKNNVLMIADEVQSGMGRTGTMFAMEQYGVEADLTTSAKSLAAGMPLSAVVGKKEIMDSVHASGIGGTYNGNPLSCAAALAVFEIFEEEKLLEKGQKLGVMLRESLLAMQQECDMIGDVRGLGPMVAMELVKDKKTKEPAGAEAKALVKYCLDRGVIILACGAYGNNIRFLMPLVMTEEQLQQGIDIVRQGLAAIRS
ncbi:4-aminobutyrate--2-oxoglutarate transaminase [Desulfoprunum benzoelyticum]|uniref:4-aminobutyrate aminotransferase/(S)-3-amino-2-methylpropionate transaminase n=1 Tax=Desulfoprunum benzoelyticum TaxID=1506996 RepID=A0A840UXQ2_9BACT|nr:4-aminobutyrate--2-oxoglutarate transaminase [Desulfoprunum benzoelyticum]MBB5349713.1 4-aminobutyrate aminotransferase/(S)-3-amino-2-methylpropionate transaminase [Desulfoprunum benzoelyticum]MBM9531857.1 4-aminobutyrate--2-oxoglutarate transaminase [Desulfoprunum benzoelyticum]